MSAPMHSALPWALDETTGEILLDAPGHLVVDCGARPTTPRDRAQANAALIQRATGAHPLLIGSLQAAAHALRAYQSGNASPDLAKEIADCCDAVLAQMEAC